MITLRLSLLSILIIVPFAFVGLAIFSAVAAPLHFMQPLQSFLLMQFFGLCSLLSFLYLKSKTLSARK